jgi:peptide/nickel transport system ATP-binding protein
VFHTRCPRKLGRICEAEEPPLHSAGNGHDIRCHIPASELGSAEADGTAPKAAVG